jgi:hypothetical protein
MRSASHLAAIALALTGLAQIVSAQPVELTCKNQYGQEGRVIFDESAHTAAFLYGSTELAYGDMVSADFTDTTIQWRGQHGEKPQYSLSRITGTLMVTHSINWQCQKATQKF